MLIMKFLRHPFFQLTNSPNSLRLSNLTSLETLLSRNKFHKCSRPYWFWDITSLEYLEKIVHMQPQVSNEKCSTCMQLYSGEVCPKIYPTPQQPAIPSLCVTAYSPFSINPFPPSGFPTKLWDKTTVRNSPAIVR